MTQIQKLRAEALNALFFVEDSILIDEITILIRKSNLNDTITVIGAVSQLLNIIRYLANIKRYKMKYLKDAYNPTYTILTCGTRHNKGATR